MRPVSPLVAVLLLVACGCGDPGPTTVPGPPDAATGLGALSEAGHLAHRVLNDSETLASGVEAKGGWLPAEVLAFRLLLREEPAAAKAAFADLRVPGGGARRLYGLCGAWYTDRVAFEAGCQELAKWPDAETVRFQSGCEIFEKVPVAALVRSRGAFPPPGPDIESGGLPRILGGRKRK